MGIIHLDFETYSDINIKKAGAFRYIQSPAFEILLCAYSVDDGPVRVLDLTVPQERDYFNTAFKDLIFRSDSVLMAYNAAFEAGCIARHFGVRFTPAYVAKFRDTMLHGLYAGYTAGLDATGRALGIPEDKQKLTTGKALIRYFCVPCKPTKANGGRTRNYPHHDPEKWALFKTYNGQDVVAEMEIERRLSVFPVPDFVQKQWETDLLINARGVAVDMDFCEGALELGETIRAKLTDEAVQLSGLQNPNSVKQLARWLSAETGDDITTLRKETIKELLGRDNADHVQRMLEIRQELGKTSTKKYDAIEAAVCDDGRVRGLLQFYGANRTGRWAGRLVQVQNLPRTYTEPLEFARELVKGRKLDALRTVYGSPNDTLSQLIRTAFVAAPGNVLIDADFSAIEARVISWLADEEWRLEVFRTHGKIYEASASQMFGVPLERIKKGNPEYSLRQRGKVAELALGYQGGVPAMRQMDTGKLLADLPDEEIKDIVDKWRNTNPKIRNLWYSFNDAAIRVIQNGGSLRVRCCTFARECDCIRGTTCMTVSLPSGRKLYYVEPSVGENRWGGPSITYMGVNDKNKWGRIETYGGKLVENVVQAIARDCLAQAIEHLEAAGLPVVFHIHDEVVIDTAAFDTNDAMLDKVVKIMSTPIPWAEGLPLGADGWVGAFFKKD